MAASTQKKRSCCSTERKRLVEELRKCDFCADSYEEFHQCYRDVARQSGERSKSCMVA